MTAGLAAVVLMAFGATAASARPSPQNPPAPTGTLTVSTGGAVTVTASGTWSWAVGTQKGEINANATPGHQCGGKYGVGWGIVWNDPDDPGYQLKYSGAPAQFVGSTTSADGNAVDENVHVGSPPCGTFSPAAVTGPWTASHVYADAASVPTTICVVSYVLKHAPKTLHSAIGLVDKNKRNSFHTAVSAGLGATWATSSACFDPSTFKSTSTIVTTATNAQVGSPITDTAVLTGTTHTVTPVDDLAAGGDLAAVGNLAVVSGKAGGTIVFKLYGPSDTNCTSTPIYTSTAIPVSGNGTYGPTSFTPTQGAGTYRWIATYSGDVTNNGATELCGAAGETSTVSAAPVTAPANQPTSTSASTPVVTSSTTATPTATPTSTASNTATSTPAAITGATTVHTGEPWAGSKPYVVAVVAFGLSLMGLGFFERRRTAVRRQAVHSTQSTD
ncbi:MAG TPA: hypothetical protein VN816_05660 [Acidimicrobiales bacterium]|nr:hypothetical protein [Acidimicrobiales bacterium]